jgi:hypothetical protein
VSRRPRRRKEDRAPWVAPNQIRPPATNGSSRPHRGGYDGYLGRPHRDKRETGCAVAAFPTDIARCGRRARAAYSRLARGYLGMLTELTTDEILEGTARALHSYVEGAREV